MNDLRTPDDYSPLKGKSLEWYKEYFETLSKTRSHEKVWNYIKEIIKTKDFLEKVKQIRRKHNLPEDGREAKIIKDERGNDHVPLPPESITVEFHNDIQELSEKIGLDFIWSEVIWDFVVFNELTIATHGSLFFVSDTILEHEDPFEENTQRIIRNTYPIALRISAYATQKDILDFVSKMYRYEIEPLQVLYKNNKVKIGKFRKKKASIQTRNDYIWKNQELPRRKLAQLVLEKFNESLDYAYIGKIISNENNRRK